MGHNLFFLNRFNSSEVLWEISFRHLSLFGRVRLADHID